METKYRIISDGSVDYLQAEFEVTTRFLKIKKKEWRYIRTYEGVTDPWTSSGFGISYYKYISTRSYRNKLEYFKERYPDVNTYLDKLSKDAKEYRKNEKIQHQKEERRSKTIKYL